jgi:hypothetical protein
MAHYAPIEPSMDNPLTPTHERSLEDHPTPPKSSSQVVTPPLKLLDLLSDFTLLRTRQSSPLRLQLIDLTDILLTLTLFLLVDILRIRAELGLHKISHNGP